jgi:dTDP-glucose 4,6-dehydratase
MGKNRLLVTGGAGFIGSEFVRLLAQKDYHIVVVDKLTYAGDLKRLEEVKGKYAFYKVDIRNKVKVEQIFKNEKPDMVIHLAAESHVDRSIQCADDFIKTNILGTQTLLDMSRNKGIRKFIHISTDEVYGDIEKGQSYEISPLKPGSPYSASKASADLLIKLYIRTFNFPATIVRPSNNYGPWQHPEKFIPVIIYKALKNERVPIYGKGVNVREWLYVSDCADAILKVLEEGKLGEIYNIGSGNERRNIETVREILRILGKSESLVEFVQDRPGHDLRYSLNYCRINNDLGWNPKVDFNVGIRKTVEWYRMNVDWLERKARYLRDHWEKVYRYR